MKSPASLRSDRVATFPGLGGRFHRNTQGSDSNGAKSHVKGRSLVAILGERGLSISHTTILRWVIRYAETC